MSHMVVMVVNISSAAANVHGLLSSAEKQGNTDLDQLNRTDLRQPGTMSALELSFQTQVETVLGALVKEATAELTKLFESCYQASSTTSAIHFNGPAAAAELSGAPVGCVCKSQRKVVRSIGVQVTEIDPSPSEEFIGKCKIVVAVCNRFTSGCRPMLC